LLAEDRSKICTICIKGIADFRPALWNSAFADPPTAGFHRVKMANFKYWLEVSCIPNSPECLSTYSLQPKISNRQGSNRAGRAVIINR
jgi:hypothetical protein